MTAVAAPLHDVLAPAGRARRARFAGEGAGDYPTIDPVHLPRDGDASGTSASPSSPTRSARRTRRPARRCTPRPGTCGSSRRPGGGRRCGSAGRVRAGPPDRHRRGRGGRPGDRRPGVVTFDLATTTVGRTATAKDVRSLRRRFVLDGDVLTYDAVDGPRGHPADPPPRGDPPAGRLAPRRGPSRPSLGRDEETDRGRTPGRRRRRRRGDDGGVAGAPRTRTRRARDRRVRAGQRHLLLGLRDPLLDRRGRRRPRRAGGPHAAAVPRAAGHRRTDPPRGGRHRHRCGTGAGARPRRPAARPTTATTSCCSPPGRRRMRPDLPGIDGPGVFGVQTLDDGQAIIDHLDGLELDRPAGRSWSVRATSASRWPRRS